ncbi:septum formation family protein [Agromyces arachidis]|uniref:septum formation family protein n=1 Tax=Agromyces arachidis TaxID=766966 RepID=UPI004056E25F
MVTTRTLARPAALVAAALLAASLTGCSAIGQFLTGPAQPERDATTQEITEAGDADVFALRVGDCLDMVVADQVESVPVVPCSEPHSDEVYHDFQMPDGEFPGDDAVNSAAETGCLDAFQPFVGMAFEESQLDISWYVPTQDSWNQMNDRAISCMVSDPAGEVTGTLAGAAY